MRLPPKHYLVIKDALVCESLRLGYLSKKQAGGGRVCWFRAPVQWVVTPCARWAASGWSLKHV